MHLVRQAVNSINNKVVTIFTAKGKSKRKRRTGRAVALYKPLPASMNVRLRARTYETASATASPIYFRYGLVEPLGFPGQYSDSLFGLYKLARIHGAKVTIRAVNIGSEPVILAIAPLPHDWTSGSPTLAELLDHPACKRITLSAYTGMDRGVVSSYTTASKVLGDEFQTGRYNVDATQAASTTPMFANEPAWVVVCSAFNALTSISFRLEVEFEYEYKFFNLNSI